MSTQRSPKLALSAVNTHPKRTHQIGVRVSEDELKRLELRASLHPFGQQPLATYLRSCGLDLEPRPDPTPELIAALQRVADELAHHREPIDRTSKLQRAITNATDTLRQLIAKVG